MVFCVLCTSMYMTRRREFNVFGSSHEYRALPLNSPDLDSDDLVHYDIDSENGAREPVASTKGSPKRRNLWCGLKLYTPNSSRFVNRVHSRLLQKFPFLIEMFYWISTYLAYRMTKAVSQAIFHQDKIWDVAQKNAVRILWFEQDSPFSWIFPIREHDVQQWFIHGHQTELTFLNRAYALIHIPGTVG